MPFFANLLLMSILLKVGHYYEWYDEIDERKVHTGNIPRIGGIGIFWTSVLSIVLFLFIAKNTQLMDTIFQRQYLSVIIACVLIHLVGLLDDFKNLRPHYKLLAQVGAALIFIGAGNSFQQVFIPILDRSVELGVMGPVVSFLWIIGVTNAINLIDGIDGLSGSLSGVAALYFGLAAVSVGNYPAAIVSMAILGALLGFLFFNFPPAKIFMGDSGSLYIGFSMSILPILVFQSSNPSYALPYGATLLVIPILDTLAAIIRRRRRKQPFHTPDKQHLHHKLLTFGYSNHTILVILTGASTFIGYFAFLWVRVGTPITTYVLTFLWVTVLFFFLVLHYINKKVRLQQQKDRMA